jgi:CHAT domain-containing protein
MSMVIRAQSGRCLTKGAGIFNGAERVTKLKFSLAFWVCLIFVPGDAHGQESDNAASAEPIPLQAGVAVEQQQSQHASQQFTYLFHAIEEHPFLIQVDQGGLDFIISVESPDGSRHAYNTPLERDEREVVLIENPQSGEYLISLESKEITDATGKHTIQVLDIKSSEAEDETYINSLRHMTAGAAAYAIDDLANKERARAEYALAAQLWDQLGRDRERAQALYSIAYLNYWVHYDFTASIKAAEEAADIYLNELGEASLYANVSLLGAAAMLEDLEFDQALARAKDALLRHQESGNQYDAARAEELIGYALHRKGELSASVDFRRRAANHFSEVGEWYKAFIPRARVAIIELDRGYSSRAIDTLEEIRNRLLPEADPFFRAEVLDGLGDAYRLNGMVNEALASYDAALEQHRMNEDLYGEAVALRGLGKTYLISGHLDLAASFLRDAVAMAEGLNFQIQEQSLTSLGTIDYLKGNYEGALELHLQALKLLRRSEPDEAGFEQLMSRVDHSNRLVLIGRDLTALGRYVDAKTHLDNAKALLGEIDVPFHFAAANHELGRAYQGEGHIDAAILVLQNAFDAYESIGSQDGQAAVLHELAKAHRALESLEIAVGFGEDAIDRVEGIRASIAKPELRALFSETRRGYYEAQVDLLFQLHDESQSVERDYQFRALTVNERSRARMTMDLIAEASVNIRRGIAPELRARERELRDELAARVYQLESPGGASQRVLGEMVEYEHELTLLENKIRADNPLYLGFSTPDTLTAAQFQPLLDPETVLLQYSLGEQRSFVWVVTPDSIRGVELAGRKSIELAAKRLLKALRTYPTNSTELGAARDTLSGYVLAPVREHLLGRRIIVVADGGLHYVPFSVLPLNTNEPEKLLVMTHEVVGLPSMSVLNALRNARESRLPASKTVAVFADPIFSPSDPRLERTTDTPSSARAGFGDRLFDSRYQQEMGLNRLQNTEYEAQAIEALVPEDQRMIARGFAANREQVVEGALNQYRVLHFATHGEVNTGFPGLSKLFLSNFNDQGRYESGTLLLEDIYNLELNADLVVLSACDTALGQEIRGEGLVGFTQGFLYAGASSLLVSLWKVPDRATAELMKRFYSYVLDSEGNLKPAEALQKAQSSMAAERRWRDPYLWAAFVLQGDWQ